MLISYFVHSRFPLYLFLHFVPKKDTVAIGAKNSFLLSFEGIVITRNEAICCKLFTNFIISISRFRLKPIATYLLKNGLKSVPIDYSLFKNFSVLASLAASSYFLVRGFLSFFSHLSPGICGGFGGGGGFVSFFFSLILLNL